MYLVGYGEGVFFAVKGSGGGVGAGEGPGQSSGGNRFEYIFPRVFEVLEAVNQAQTSTIRAIHKLSLHANFSKTWSVRHI